MKNISIKRLLFLLLLLSAGRSSICACQMENIGGEEEVSKWTRARANLIGTKGYTELRTACWEGNLSITNKLIEANADVNLLEKNGSTALIGACFMGNLSIAKKLIEAKADPNLRGSKDDTALKSACFVSSFNIAKMLIEENADPNSKGCNGNTALIEVCNLRGIDKRVIQMLIEADTDVNLQNKHGATALIRICKRDYDTGEKIVATIRALIKARADINLQNNDGDTALMCAYPCEQNIKMLTESNANINLKENYEKSAIKWTMNSNIIEIFLERDAFVNFDAFIDFNEKFKVLQPGQKQYLLKKQKELFEQRKNTIRNSVYISTGIKIPENIITALLTY